MREPGKTPEGSTGIREATILYFGKPYRIFCEGRFWDCRIEDPEIVSALVAEHRIMPSGNGVYAPTRSF